MSRQSEHLAHDSAFAMAGLTALGSDVSVDFSQSADFSALMAQAVSDAARALPLLPYSKCTEEIGTPPKAA